MSDVFYPLGKIESLEVTLNDRTVMDDFEDGSSSTRRLWAEKNFKRRFKLVHAPMAEAEFRYLRSFFTARNGRYDSFWFRDNVHRSGNAKVRLARPFVISKNGSRQYRVELELEEVAPVRVLPDMDEVNAAWSSAPGNLGAWFDPNRILYAQSGISTYQETEWKDQMNQFDLVWNSTPFALQNTVAQYQHLDPGDSGQGVCTSVGNYFGVSNTSPPLTIFMLLKSAGSGISPRILASIGAGNAGVANGIACLAIYGGSVYPYIGGNGTWTGAAFPANTWCSVAVTYFGSAATLFVNGASTASGSSARSFSPGAIAVGGSSIGQLNFENALTTRIAHVLLLPTNLVQSQIKALHNLFAYQYGMATV